MTNHLASLHMNLSPEGWSRTSHVEAAIENELSSEENARRRAVDARKEAERLRREAEVAKDAQEQRWRRRQEEKARYTDAQRSWWDEEIIHLRQAGDAKSTSGQTHLTASQLEAQQDEWERRKLEAVSYTHLTLPTKA